MKVPELLAPAGDLDRMRTAFDFGADAVYAGQPRYSLRARNNDFSMANIEVGINEAHARGKNSLWRVIFYRTTPKSKPIWQTWSQSWR